MGLLCMGPFLYVSTSVVFRGIVRAHAHTYMRAFIFWMHACMLAHIHTHARMCTHACMHAYTCLLAFMHIHVCTHKRTYTHIHTRSLSLCQLHCPASLNLFRTLLFLLFCYYYAFSMCTIPPAISEIRRDKSTYLDSEEPIKSVTLPQSGGHSA